MIVGDIEALDLPESDKAELRKMRKYLQRVADGELHSMELYADVFGELVFEDKEALKGRQ